MPNDYLGVYIEASIKDCLIAGNIDVITINGIRNTRIGKRPRPYHTQLGGCANLLKATRGIIPENLVTDYLPRNKIEKPYGGTITETYDVKFSMTESWFLIQKLIRDINNFKKNGNPASFQANPNSQLCNPKYCMAFGTDFCGYCGKI
jgi:hypothetical protein